MFQFPKKLQTSIIIGVLAVFMTNCGVVRQNTQSQNRSLNTSSTPTIIIDDSNDKREGQDLASIVFGEDVNSSGETEAGSELSPNEETSSPFTRPPESTEYSNSSTSEVSDDYSVPRIITENLPDGVAFIQTGIASWYGPDFHGRNTANGEIYDMDDQTAAHKSLPFDTQVIVENQTNGKRIQLRINDRGPYAKDRVIDLSRAGAQAIDMIGPGTAPVKIYVLDDGSGNVFPTKPHYTVQLGSYDNRGAAEKKSAEIRSSYVAEVMVNGLRYYRVYFGDFENPAIAIEAMNRLKGLGHEGFIKQINK
jgi:rare lipoprotein A